MSNIPNELMPEVRRILLEEWDPIGISEFPGAQDEYDAYVLGVSKMICSGKSDEQLYGHLHWIECERMGLDGNEVRTRNVAMKLASLLGGERFEA
jgi:hypothetical protein